MVEFPVFLLIMGLTTVQRYCAACDLTCSLPIHKICALCGMFTAISVLLTTENSDDLEIQVLDGSRPLKVTPVNSSCVIFLLVINCNQGCTLIVPFMTNEIAFDRSKIALFC